MLYLGCHLSSSAGLYKAVRQAKSIDANTFQFFTRNPDRKSTRLNSSH